MKFIFTLIIMISCGVIGYLIEPLIFDHLLLQKNELSADPNKLPPKPKSKLDTPTLPSITINIKKAKPAPPAATIAEASTPPLQTKKTEKKNILTDTTRETQIQKPAFPIASLELDRYDRNSSTGSPNLEKAIHFAINNNHFEGLVTLLEKDLYKPVSENKEIAAKDLNKLTDNASWNHSLNVYTLLQLFTPDELGQAATITPEAEKFYSWMLTTPEALTQLLQNITPQDDLSKALIIWQNIWASEDKKEMRTKYLNLAIACALVFDKGQIIPKTGYDPIEPLPRYTLYRKNAEAHRLKTTLSKLKVADLVWVIDAPISDLEIEWALRHTNYSRRNWGRAYGEIEYLMERAVNGHHPYSEYTFAEIKKHGGICGDQTYFSVNTAKANGIPAAAVSGSNNSGAHAWLAYKPKDNQWKTTTGRTVDYSNGQSPNSQTNEKISEFDFILMSDRKMKPYKVQEAQTLLRFAPILVSMKHDPVGIRQTLEEALDVAPLLEQAWIDYLAFLENLNPEPTKNEWEKIISTIERTFKEHPSMWLTARALTKKHIWKDLNAKDIEKLQSRYRQEIARKFPSRSDLIRKVIAEQSDMIVKEKDFAATRSFYRKTLRMFGEDTLNFKFIAARYFACGKHFPNDREQICDDIESYFSRSLDEESGDYFKAGTEITIIKIISGYYRNIGNERKAKKLFAEAEKRSKKSIRRAL